MKNVGELFNNAHPEQKKVILSTSPNIEVITERIVDKERKKTLKVRKNVRHLQVGGTRQAFTLYRKKYPKRKISLSSFRKYTPKNIKKAKRDSDLCTLSADGFKTKKN